MESRNKLTVLKKIKQAAAGHVSHSEKSWVYERCWHLEQATKKDKCHILRNNYWVNHCFLSQPVSQLYYWVIGNTHTGMYTVELTVLVSQCQRKDAVSLLLYWMLIFQLPISLITMYFQKSISFLFARISTKINSNLVMPQFLSRVTTSSFPISLTLIWLLCPIVTALEALMIML